MPSPPDSPSPRERILDAASAVFAEVGFAGARVDEIARRADINKAMLYYHVGDKEALYTAVLLRNFERVHGALDEAMAAGGTVGERLQTVIDSLVELLRRYPDHPRIVLREVASGGANLPPEVLVRMLGLLQMVGGLLADGVEAGELRPTDPVLTHLTVVGAVLFLTSITPLRERAASLGPPLTLPEPTTDIGSFLSDLLLGGLGAIDHGESS
jgi:AcrR family transcriptional regulator